MGKKTKNSSNEIALAKKAKNVTDRLYQPVSARNRSPSPSAGGGKNGASLDQTLTSKAKHENRFDFAGTKKTELSLLNQYAPRVQDTQFTFEKAGADIDSDTPYYLQGNPEMETPAALKARHQLRRSRLIQFEIAKYWSVYAKNKKGEVEKAEYCKMHARITKALIPSFSDSEAAAVAEEDWSSDSRGRTAMDYPTFYDAIFEIVDMWTENIDLIEYVTFLRVLFRRIIVIKLKQPDGTVRVVQPLSWDESSALADRATVREWEETYRLEDEAAAVAAAEKAAEEAAAAAEAAAEAAEAAAAEGGGGEEGGEGEPAPPPSDATPPTQAAEAEEAEPLFTPTPLTLEPETWKRDYARVLISVFGESVMDDVEEVLFEQADSDDIIPSSAADEMEENELILREEALREEARLRAIRLAKEEEAEAARQQQLEEERQQAAEAAAAAAEEAAEEAAAEGEGEGEGEGVVASKAPLPSDDPSPSEAVTAAPPSLAPEEVAFFRRQSLLMQGRMSTSSLRGSGGGNGSLLSGEGGEGVGGVGVGVRVGADTSSGRGGVVMADPATPPTGAPITTAPDSQHSHEYSHEHEDEHEDEDEMAEKFLAFQQRRIDSHKVSSWTGDETMEEEEEQQQQHQGKHAEEEEEDESDADLVAIRAMRQGTETVHVVPGLEQVHMPRVSTSAASGGVASVASHRSQHASDGEDESLGDRGVAAPIRSTPHSPTGETEGDVLAADEKKKPSRPQSASSVRPSSAADTASNQKEESAGGEEKEKGLEPTPLLPGGSSAGASKSGRSSIRTAARQGWSKKSLFKSTASGLVTRLQKSNDQRDLVAQAALHALKAKKAARLGKGNRKGHAADLLSDQHFKSRVEARKRLGILGNAPIYGKSTMENYYSYDREFAAHLVTPRPNILVMGPPGSGKTTLAQGIAATLGMLCLSAETLLQEAMENPLHEYGSMLQKRLLTGGQTTWEDVLFLAEERLNSRSADFRGVVFDWFLTTPEYMALLQSAGHFPIITITLDLGEEDLIRRRRGFRFDPESAQLLSAAALAELREPAPGPIVNDDGDEEEVPDPLEGRRISDEQALRLLRRNGDAEGVVREALMDYQKSVAESQSVRDAHIPPAMAIRLPGLQSEKNVLEAALLALRDRGVTKLPRPTPLILPAELAEEEAAEEDRLQWILEAELGGGLAKRCLAKLGSLDIVTLHKTGKKVTGTARWACDFGGRVLLFESRFNRDAFCSDPRQFMLEKPEVAPKHLVLYGPPLCGKTTQASILERLLDFHTLDLQELLEEEGSDQLLKALQKGEFFDPALCARRFMHKLRSIRRSGVNGLVMDEFPLDPAMTKEMLERGFRPTVVVFVDEEGEVTEKRSSGLYWDTVEERQVYLSSPLDASTALVKYPTAQRLNAFNASKDAILELYRSFNCEIVEVPCGSSVISVNGLLRKAIDPLFPAVSSEECNLSEMLENGKKINYGNYGIYDPIALKDQGLLLKGSPEIACAYFSYFYTFVTPENMETFKMNPEFYVQSSKNHAPHVPAPRLLLTGPQGTGRHILGAHLQSTYGLQLLDADRLVEAAMEKPSMAYKHLATETMLALQASREEDPEAPLPPELLAQLLVDALKPPHKGPHTLIKSWQAALQNPAGVLLLAAPKNLDMLTALCESGALAPDCVIQTSCSEAAVVERRYVAPEMEEIEKMVPEEEGGEEGGGAEGEDGEGEEPTAEESAARLAARQEQLQAAMDEEVEKRKAAIIEQWEAETGALDGLGDACSERRMDYDAVTVSWKDGSMAEAALYHVREQVKKYVDARESKLATALACSPAEAEDLWSRGIKTLSTFRESCPVELLDRHARSAPCHAFPVVYRHHVIYCATEANREKFLANPVKYMGQNPPPPRLTTQCAIVGPPKSGKSALAQALALKLHAVYLSTDAVMDWALHLRDSALGEEVQSALRQSQTISDGLYVRCLRQRMDLFDCQARGWVLDGFPLTAAQAELLELQEIIPRVVFHLQVAPEELALRAQRLLTTQGSTTDLTFHAAAHQRLQSQWDQQAPALLAYYESSYDNIQQLDGSKSKWFLTAQAHSLCQMRQRARQNYTMAVKAGVPAPIFGANLRLNVIREHLGKIGNFCPVQLIEEGRLQQGSERRRFAVEYAGCFYNLSGEAEMDLFILDPERYVRYGRLPPDMPEKLSETEGGAVEEGELALLGFDPVLWQQKLPGYLGLKLGNPALAVRYRQRVYRFISPQHLAEFMGRPWEFCNGVLPKKLPPKQEPLKVESIPIPGYVQQSVGEEIIEAMVEVSNLRPHYPGLSNRRSAELFVAIYLKAKNARNDAWLSQRAHSRLQSFVECCEIVPTLAARVNQGTLTEREKDEVYVKATALFDAISSQADDLSRFFR